MYDPIFYPDRSPKEVTRLNQERAEFFKTVVRRQEDPLFWPDREPEEVLELRRKGKEFFEAAMRRKPTR